MIGVNLAGAEFGSGRGVYGTDYIYPNATELDYYHSKGVALIRLPFSWERMQHSLGGDLDQAELGRMTEFLDAAAQRGMHVVIDLHNFGRYDNQVIGSNSVPIAAFADFWGKLAGALAGNPAVSGFGLMNEPHDMGGPTVWPAAAQAAVDAIRETGSQQNIIVSGDNWSTAADWQNTNANLIVNDPLAKILYEAHAYFDKGGMGTYAGYDADGGYPTLGVDRVQPFIDWLKANNLNGFIGEFGVPDDDPRWLQVLDNFLHVLDENNIPATYWAGGPWWGSNSLAIEPSNGADRPQMHVLERYTDGTHNPELGYAVIGTAGDDHLLGGADGSTIFGYDGNDTLAGAAGSDVLWGGNGNDTLNGGGSTDWLYGGDGADILGGQDGNDILWGGNGDDQLHGDAGSDTLHGDTGNDVLEGGEGNDILNGGDGNDTLRGGVGDDNLRGDAGDDLLSGNDGNDTLAGGIGNDTLYGDAGDDVLGGQAGNDVLYGGIGNDRLYGDEGDDALNGGDGGDLLDGGLGNDQLHGDDGDDILHGAGGDDLLFGDAGNDQLFGDDGNDTMDGGAGNDILYGGAGNDQLSGGDGDDMIYGEVGDDILNGGAGNDRIAGGAGNDKLDGGTGDDVLGGHDGDDRLLGGAGNDKLYGDAGNDRFEGGAGDDELWGGAGADIFSFGLNSGMDRIMDFMPGADMLDLNGQHYTFSDTPEGVALVLSGGGTVIIEHVSASAFQNDWILAQHPTEMRPQWIVE
jgi:Ca2+-binding RTX toxin-like protein